MIGVGTGGCLLDSTSAPAQKTRFHPCEIVYLFEICECEAMVDLILLDLPSISSRGLFEFVYSWGC
jgi:hypothetical protein